MTVGPAVQQGQHKRGACKVLSALRCLRLHCRARVGAKVSFMMWRVGSQNTTAEMQKSSSRIAVILMPYEMGTLCPSFLPRQNV